VATLITAAHSPGRETPTEATRPAAAWYYPDPSDAAAQIAGYLAFWHGVEVRE
jgi:uncharacterized protein (DUF427 family)